MATDVSIIIRKLFPYPSTRVYRGSYTLSFLVHKLKLAEELKADEVTIRYHRKKK